MKTEEIIQAIREQQIECSHYVYLRVLREQEIEKLLLEGNYFYVEKDNKILLSFYLKLLSKKNKIYRVGGFTVSNIESPSFLTKKEVIKLVATLKEYVLKYNINFIADINRISLEKYYINVEAKRVSFKECSEQYPLFLKLFLDDYPERTIESFKSQIFYVREAKI